MTSAVSVIELLSFGRVDEDMCFCSLLLLVLRWVFSYAQELKKNREMFKIAKFIVLVFIRFYEPSNKID